jgi:hypothetical protein
MESIHDMMRRRQQDSCHKFQARHRSVQQGLCALILSGANWNPTLVLIVRVLQHSSGLLLVGSRLLIHGGGDWNSLDTSFEVCGTDSLTTLRPHAQLALLSFGNLLFQQ